MAALTLLAALLGATALAYNVLANARVTAVGRADLVRRPRPVRELPRRPAGALAPRGPRPGAAALARVPLEPAPPRRGAGRLRDHLRLVPRRVPPVRRRQRHVRPARDLPRARCRSCSASATSSSSSSGSTGGSGASRRARDLLAIARRGRRSPCRSRSRSSGDPRRSPTSRSRSSSSTRCSARRSSPARASALRLLPGLRAARAARAERVLDRRRRPLRPGASHASSRETPDTRVVGFLDDNPACAGGGSTASRSSAASTRSSGCSARCTARRGARDDPGRARRSGWSRRRRRASRRGRRRAGSCGSDDRDAAVAGRGPAE